MEKTIEQCAAIRFCWKASFKVTKTFEMIQKVYCKSAVNCATVFHWYNTFLERREFIRNEQRSGRSVTTRTRENIAHIADILKEDQRHLCRLIAERIGL